MSRASHEGGFSPTLSYPNFGRPIREGAKRALSRSRVPGPGSGRDGRRVLTGRAGLGVLAGVRGEEPGGGGSGWCVADVIVSSRADAVAFTPRAGRRARRASAPARRGRSRRARRESRAWGGRARATSRRDARVPRDDAARGGRAPPSNSRDPLSTFPSPVPTADCGETLTFVSRALSSFVSLPPFFAFA